MSLLTNVILHLLIVSVDFRLNFFMDIFYFLNQLVHKCVHFIPQLTRFLFEPCKQLKSKSNLFLPHTQINFNLTYLHSLNLFSDRISWLICDFNNFILTAMPFLWESLIPQNSHSRRVLFHNNWVSRIRNHFLRKSRCIKLVQHDGLPILFLVFEWSFLQPKLIHFSSEFAYVLTKVQTKVLALTGGEVGH